MINIIETKNLHKNYTLKKIIVNALRGVDLTINEGEFSALVGPSGSGKSTLLHIVGCIDTPTEGEVHVDNKNVEGLTKNDLAMLRRKKLGFIFQAYNLIPVLTAYENVSFPLTLLGMNKNDIREKSIAALKNVGLEGLEKRRPMEMSGGQQQRVAIARALVKEPRLVLADEPTANLDSKTGSDIMEIMLKLNEETKTTFLLSTHDPMVIKFAKRVIHIRDGKISKEEKK